MKWKPWFFGAIGFVAAFYLVMRENQTQNQNATSSASNQATMQSPVSESPSQNVMSGQNSSTASTQKAAENRQIIASELKNKTESELIGLADLTSGSALRAVVITLSNRPRESAVAAVKETFYTKPELRKESLWFARELNGPEFVQLWSDVLTRKSPLADNESETLQALQNNEHPIEFKDQVTAEQFQAIEGLAQNMNQSEDVRKLLTDVVMQKVTIQTDPLFIRKKALEELYNVDHAVLFELAAVIPQNDPLRRSLVELSGPREVMQ